MHKVWESLDYTSLPSPCFLIHEGLLEDNCRKLDRVQKETGAKILLALKGYAAFSTFPIINRYLKGTTASGIHEALLGHEMFGGETHVYAPAFKEPEIKNLVRFAHTITFNSLNQWREMKQLIEAAPRKIACGIRMNPGYSEVETEIYNPCAAGSRLGTPLEQLLDADLNGIDGLHFHTLCEQNSDTLGRTLEVIESKASSLLKKVQWINFGGGHHITRDDYNISLLCDLITRFKAKHNLEVYLEPGEAIGLNTGILTATVLDIVDNEKRIAILDTSATAHMPDVLEMPYRPEILGADDAGKHPYTYRLGGLTCLAGDIIGDYSFPAPLQIGQQLIFGDMAHYSMVKTTTFNGVPHPAIATYSPEKDCYTVVRQFAYSDYRNKLS